MNALTMLVNPFSIPSRLENSFVLLKNFHLKSPCPMVHKHYLRYNSLFRNSIEKFISENYQVIFVFDDAFCSILSQSEFVQYAEPTSLGYMILVECVIIACNGSNNYMYR